MLLAGLFSREVVRFDMLQRSVRVVWGMHDGKVTQQHEPGEVIVWKVSSAGRYCEVK